MEIYNLKTDEYIAKAADFAKPILTHIRELVHQASPLIGEAIKWGHVHFDYKGTVCSMAAFKQHCALGFWKQSLIPDVHHLFKTENEGTAGSIGRITTLADLPPDAQLIEYIRKAVQLNEENVKVSKTVKPKAELLIPDYFTDTLDLHPEAKATFDKFSPSHRREYVDWITEAKTDATRQKRLQQAMEMMSEGKSRHYKHR